MMKGECLTYQLETHDYGMPNAFEKGKEAKNPPLPLQIEIRCWDETLTRIPKGAFKKASHNPNARATHNCSVVEDLSETPCVMSCFGSPSEISLPRERLC
jgi:hypothetical protein